jgi:hypothetical protein
MLLLFALRLCSFQTCWLRLVLLLLCLQGSPNLADALQRQLVREPTPSLKLLPPEVTALTAATTTTTPGAQAGLQLGVGQVVMF